MVKRPEAADTAAIFYEPRLARGVWYFPFEQIPMPWYACFRNYLFPQQVMLLGNMGRTAVLKGTRGNRKESN
jgi:hypothetical protein